ncbi:MAG: hypothetical protein NTX45_11270 [Proteobacteria bacterium]|nr:hypothetical protein [Pseudomonadota bacterium]
MSVQPSIEIIPNYKGMHDVSEPPAGDPLFSKKRKNQRLLLFLAVFSLCLTASLSYVWLRSPVYQSMASLLTVAPEEAGLTGGSVTVHQVTTQEEGLLPSIPIAAIERSESPANPEHVTLHRQILLGVPVFEETLRRLYEQKVTSASPRLNLNDLRRLLSVDMVKGTNMVEMKAQGPQPQILAPLVNAWVDAYQALREQTTRDAASNNYAALEDESRQLVKKVESKRKALEEFRATHDILSRTDSDNTPMMRLKGLNESLNKATAEQVKAKATLESIRGAIAQGKPVMPPEEAPGLANLEKRAQELREILKDTQRRFTPTYMAMNPQMKQLPEKLAQVEAAIKEKIDNGSRAVVSQAEQDYATGIQSVQELRQQIAGMKLESSEFTNRFAEQQTMADDLKRLEVMHRDIQAKLAHIESRPEEPYPPLQVVERAYPPTEAYWPHYWRDTGIGLFASLIFAILFIWLYDYLTRIEEAPAPVPAMPSFQFYSVQGNLPSHQREEEAPALPAWQAPAPMALESPFPRELTVHEIHILLDAADAMTKQWIGLLLSGLSIEEAAGLGEANLNLATNRITVEGASPRTVPLAPRLRDCFVATAAVPSPTVHRDAEEISARIACAGFDSGLSQPETIDAATVRHTYIAYLVRQGIRLSELEHIVGRFPAKNLALYGRLSPSGPGLPASRVARVHPALFGGEVN